MRDDGEGRAFLFLSSMGAIMIAIMLLLPEGGPESLTWQREVVAVLLVISFASGISMSIRPNWSKVIMERGRKAADPPPGMDRSIKARRGHHPDCPVFKDHIVVISGRTFCAGCLGLLIGCIASLTLVIVYILQPSIVPPTSAWMLAMVGTVIVMANLIEGRVPLRSRPLHMTLNALLPIGFWMVTIGVLEHTGILFDGIAALIICYLWLETRKVLSGIGHRAICHSCMEECAEHSL